MEKKNGNSTGEPKLSPVAAVTTELVITVEKTDCISLSYHRWRTITMKIPNEGYLKEQGFHPYPPTPFDPDSVVRRYQKRYDDDIGKKYFLDCRIWDWSWTDKVPEPLSYELLTQLYQKGTHEAIDMTFHDSDLALVEQFIDALFDAGLVEHYEEWE